MIRKRCKIWIRPVYSLGNEIANRALFGRLKIHRNNIFFYKHGNGWQPP